MNFEQESLNDIAIVGMSLRFPGANNIEEFWSNLCQGIESVSFFTEEQLQAAGVPAAMYNQDHYVPAKSTIEDIDLFDAAFFNFSPKEAQLMDPQQRLFLECAWEAMEMAGYTSAYYDGRVGVFGGVSESTYFLFNIFSNPTMVEELGKLQSKLLNDKDFLSTRVSYKMNLQGPSLSVQTACSTGLVNVHLACQSLLSGESDMAIAGAASISLPHKAGYVYEEGNLYSPDGHCKAFDEQSEGTIFGDGVGTVVLKRLEDAIADGDTIHAVIKSSAINNDGASKVGFTAPSAKGQAKVIAEALSMADIDPASIDYIETHGTGTKLGDMIEIEALKANYSSTIHSKKIVLGSVKTNMGHLNTAAGIAGLIKTVLVLKYGQIPETVHFTKSNPRLQLENSCFTINNKLIPLNPDKKNKRAAVSSFGVGGTNVHMILEQPPQLPLDQTVHEWNIIPLSAKTENALEQQTHNLSVYLEQLNDESLLSSVAHTLQMGRTPFSHRRVIVSNNMAMTKELLNNPRDKRVISAHPVSTSQMNSSKEMNNIFMFSSTFHYPKALGKYFYDHFIKYQEKFDECAVLFQAYASVDIRQFAYAEEHKEHSIHEHHINLPIVFSTQYAITSLLMDWGIHPNAVIGYGIGEYLAAHIAGVMSLEDAIRCVSFHINQMSTHSEERAIIVQMAREDMEAYVHKHGRLAAINTADLCTVIGEQTDIDALATLLATDDIEFWDMPHTAFGVFNASSIAKQDFENLIIDLELKAPQLPYISSYSGELVGEEITDVHYWTDYISQPTDFYHAVQRIHQLYLFSQNVLYEIGIGQILSSFVKSMSIDHFHDHAVCLQTLRKSNQPIEDMELLLQTAAHAWAYGEDIHWTRVHSNRVQRLRRIPLPTYPFEKKSYWIEPEQSLFTQQVKQATEPTPIDATVAANKPSTQILVTAIYEDMLGVTNPDIHDNFFELGGSSLIAAQFLSKVNKTFDMEFSIDIIFEASTIASLTDKIDDQKQKQQENSDSQPVHANAETDIKLDASLIEIIQSAKQSDEVKSVFLTGATGFIGGHVLAELINTTNYHIYCLVRANCVDTGLARIKENMQQYLIWEESMQTRITPVLGDMSKILLGLSEHEFVEISERVQAVYHMGAWVNWIYPYSQLREANVIGTREIVKLASHHTLKAVYFMSSVAVFDTHALPLTATCYENENTRSYRDFQTGYAESKWASEQILLEAQKHGLPVMIYRSAYVTGSSVNGISNLNDFVFRMVKGCIQLHAAPYTDLYINVTPVDYVAQTIVELAQNPEAINHVYHITNPQINTWLNLLTWIHKFGYPLQTISVNEWNSRLAQTIEQSGDNALTPFLFYFAPSTKEYSEFEIPEPQGKIYDCSNTSRMLANRSIVCPVLDESLLKKYFDYLIQVEFIGEPVFINDELKSEV